MNPSMNTRNSVFQPASHATWRMLDAEKSIVLDLNTGRYYSLNKTGTLVWQMMTDRHSAGTIATHLAGACRQEEAQVETDVVALLDFLAQQKLIESAAPLAVHSTAPSLPEVKLVDYLKPQVDEHEALKQVVAGGSSSGYTGSSGGHYWYPN
jgi:hypothetical protein